MKCASEITAFFLPISHCLPMVYTVRDLVPIEDEGLIAEGYEMGVPPIMVLAPMSADMTFDTQIAHDMFVNQEGQNRLIENIATMQEKDI